MTKKQRPEKTIVKLYYTKRSVQIVFEENGINVYEFSLSIEDAKGFAESYKSAIAQAEFQDKLTNED